MVYTNYLSAFVFFLNFLTRNCRWVAKFILQKINALEGIPLSSSNNHFLICKLRWLMWSLDSRLVLFYACTVHTLLVVILRDCGCVTLTFSYYYHYGTDSLLKISKKFYFFTWINLSKSYNTFLLYSCACSMHI